jgi:importin-5
MYNVIRSAATEDDEVVLQDALIEFNEIAEIEPKFFQARFKEIFQNTMDVVGKSDFTNPLIRQQPIEFYVTVIERVPSIVKKDEELLKQMIELIFKLMVDIDSTIEDDWMRPKEGFNDSGNNDEGEDNVNFGKSCIDKIISAVGEQKCLPILSQIVDNTINNESDWRFKNAALMAFSQVGEYIEDIKNISAMVPIVLTHLKHQNPKVRHAALHCIGQISDDMTEEFQEEYGSIVLPALIESLNDPVPRVSSHCCSAITNFMDGATEELVEPYISQISPILANLMKVGISIQKETAVTAFASTAVVIKAKFDPHFGETIDLLLSCLNDHPQPCYKQFRAQIIEAITLICSGVSPETFATKSHEIIQAMLYI